MLEKVDTGVEETIEMDLKRLKVGVDMEVQLDDAK